MLNYIVNNFYPAYSKWLSFILNEQLVKYVNKLNKIYNQVNEIPNCNKIMIGIQVTSTTSVKTYQT